MDIDRRTGAVIDNYSSAVQAVEVILITRVGELLMLRQFGGGVSALLGRLMTPQLFAVCRILISAAIDIWEPRFRVRKISVDGTTDGLRLGNATFSVEVDWRPRGHLGDETVEGVRSFFILTDRSGIVAEAA